MTTPPATYEDVVLEALAYEFPSSNPQDIEAKIKRRLQRKKLGKFDPERVAVMRRLKNQLQEEIGKYHNSAYYLESTGEYAAYENFDIPRLIADMIAQYPEIPSSAIESFVPYCVMLYYLR